jgi:glucokinase-like ROK family protein
VVLNTRSKTLLALARLQGHLIVSCQAPNDDPFCNPESMARFAQAAVAAGAAGIRANGPDDIRAIRRVVDVPVIGLQKRMQPDGKILITPSFEDAASIVGAGADIVALDCTARGQEMGALERILRIRSQLNVPVMADIATVAEAVAAASAGADVVATTMRGYTDETTAIHIFDPEFIAAVVSAVQVPVIAEGRIRTPNEAARAMLRGAHAVIVGTAITRPEAIAARFVEAIELATKACKANGPVLGIDVGGTNTKFAIVMPDGSLRSEGSKPTPGSGGRERLMKHLQTVVEQALQAADAANLKIEAIGVATAGWVDYRTGAVKWATSNLFGWTGAPIADELQRATGLRVHVENDAVAAAIAERHFGAGRGAHNFVCLTLGTGVGGGSYVEGRLLRGAHSLANAFGHIPIRHDGPKCSCGRHGCLEMYTNAAALVRYAGDSYASAEHVIRAAHSGDPVAAEALRTLSKHLAEGIASIVHMLDPELVLLAGGLVQDNDLLFTYLNQELTSVLIAWDQRSLQVRRSELGYYTGVLGAAAALAEPLLVSQNQATQVVTG